MHDDCHLYSLPFIHGHHADVYIYKSIYKNSRSSAVSVHKGSSLMQVARPYSFSGVGCKSLQIPCQPCPTHIHVSIKCVEFSGRFTIACSYSICYIYSLYFALNFEVYSYLLYVPLFATRLEFSCWNHS